MATLPSPRKPYVDDWDEVPETPIQPGTSNIHDEKVLDIKDEREPIPFPALQKSTYFPALTARTSLFSASRISRDATETSDSVKVELSGQNGYRLTAWGPRLNMHDKLVWETALQIAIENQHGMGARFCISLRDFAHRMGWETQGGAALQWIWMSLRRLYFIRLDFELPNGAKGGGSMLSTAMEDQDGNFVLRLNPDFCGPMFWNDNQFLIKIKRRSTLTGQLARWLHDYFSTQRGFDVQTTSTDTDHMSEPSREMHIQLQRLRELSGYTGERKQFARELVDAMKELVAKAPELTSSFDIKREGRSSDTWILHVIRGSERPAYLVPELNRIEKQLTDPNKKPVRRSSKSSGNGRVAL